jgi:ABC-type nitrate/sulfonate/bicarbonate transport system substrate-binding protein
MNPTLKSRFGLASFVLMAGLAMVGSAFAQTKVSIGTAKDPNLAAQIVIARDKGFFKEAGLDAAVNEFPSGGDLMAAFVGGSVQLGTAGSTPVINLKSRPFPIEIIAQISDISGAQQLLVHEDVTSPEQLYGKKIGLLRGTASEALFNSIVEGYGLDRSKFEIINLGPTEMLQAFVRKQVDAVALWEPHSTRAREAGKGKTLISGTRSFIPGKEGPKRVYGDHAVLFAHADFVKNQPGTVKQAIKALEKANVFIRDNRPEALAILAKAFQLTPEQMAQIIDVNDYTLLLDKRLIDDMNKLSSFLSSLGKVEKPAEVSSWVNPQPLREVAPDMVKLN